VAEIIVAVSFDKNKVIFCSVLLKGEYGIRDVCLGVPVVVGRAGVVKVLEVKLPASERLALKSAAKKAKEVLKSI